MLASLAVGARAQMDQDLSQSQQQENVRSSPWTPPGLNLEIQGKEPMYCEREGDVEYLCGDSTILHFDMESRAYLAVSYENGKAELQPVQSVKDGGDTLYAVSTDRLKTWSAQGLYNQYAKTSRLQMVVNVIDARHGSQEFRQLQVRLANSTRTQRIQVQSEQLSDYKNLSVKLANGKKLRCQKGEPSDCQLYSCEPSGLLYMPQTKGAVSLPEFIGFDGKGLQPMSMVVQVTSKGPRQGSLLDIREASVGQISPITGLAAPDTESWPAALKDQAGTFEFLSHPENEVKLGGARRACRDPMINKVGAQLDKKVQAVRNKFAGEKMVQLIETVNDLNGLHQSSRMVDRANLSGNYCEISSGIYADKESASKLARMNVDAPHGKVLTEAEAKKLFAEVKNMKDIPYGYIRDGCHARAHVIADRLAKDGIAVGKVWVHGQNLWPKNALDKQDPPGIGWRMHVAPFVYVKDSAGRIKKMVLDPSTQSGAVSVEDFVKSIQPKSESQIFYAKWPPIMDVQNFGRTVVNFSDKEYYSDAEMPPISKEQRAADMSSATKVNEQFLEVLQERNSFQ